MEYQVSRNHADVFTLDRWVLHLERESLADFADKIEHTEQIYSNVPSRITKFQFKKIC